MRGGNGYADTNKGFIKVLGRVSRLYYNEIYITPIKVLSEEVNDINDKFKPVRIKEINKPFCKNWQDLLNFILQGVSHE